MSEPSLEARIEAFDTELQALYEKHRFYIDMHGEYVGLLVDETIAGPWHVKVVATVFGEPPYTYDTES